MYRRPAAPRTNDRRGIYGDRPPPPPPPKPKEDGPPPFEPFDVEAAAKASRERRPPPPPPPPKARTGLASLDPKERRSVALVVEGLEAGEGRRRYHSSRRRAFTSVGAAAEVPVARLGRENGHPQARAPLRGEARCPSTSSGPRRDLLYTTEVSFVFPRDPRGSGPGRGPGAPPASCPPPPRRRGDKSPRARTACPSLCAAFQDRARRGSGRRAAQQGARAGSPVLLLVWRRGPRGPRASSCVICSNRDFDAMIAPAPSTYWLISTQDIRRRLLGRRLRTIPIVEGTRLVALLQRATTETPASRTTLGGRPP